MKLVLDIKSLIIGGIIGGSIVVLRAALSVARDKITNRG